MRGKCGGWSVRLAEQDSRGITSCGHGAHPSKLWQGGAAIGHDEARFPGVANVVVLGRADFEPRDLRSDRGYRWRLGVWRLAAFGMAWIENRKEWTSTTFF